jgi:adenine-specific DNA-methyltransferase
MGSGLMKYMGSKRTMLQNGLGKLLIEQAKSAERVVDLFTGAGYVAWYIAENTSKPVLAVDLQSYAAIMAQSIIGRIENLSPTKLRTDWIDKAIESRNSSLLWREANELESEKLAIKERVKKSRELCKKQSDVGSMWSAYGGHYFSPAQALTFDYLLANLPTSEVEQTVCLAACISAATECVAAPGHTAQPFQPTETAGPFIMEAWSRDPIEYCQKALDAICPRHAKVAGKSITDDALKVAARLNEKDLVFIDPPYSSVQYSRFYHVLEAIARGQNKIDVSGVGRYISINERPQSKFSNISQSKKALKELLETLAKSGCRIIFTFPSGVASNGLSGKYIKSIASEWFYVEDHSTIKGHFSTLGGNNTHRDARKKSSELILLMKPRRRKKQIAIPPLQSNQPKVS